MINFVHIDSVMLSVGIMYKDQFSFYKKQEGRYEENLGSYPLVKVSEVRSQY